MILRYVKKTDALVSIIIGLLIGIFFWLILKVLNINFLNLNWILIVFFPLIILLGMIIASILGKKTLIIYQFAKFALVGSLNTFIDLGVLNLLIFFTSIVSGVYYSVFKAISFIVAAINSYFWNKYWTFEKKDSIFLSREFIKFFIITFIGFIINVGTASFIVNAIGPQYGIEEKIWANFGAFVAVFISFLWNFLGLKFIVFKK